MAKAKTKTYYATMRLCGGHSLILSHRPESLSLSKVNSKIEADPMIIGQFGLFDSSSPNYTTYYPEVTAEDLNPKENEFVEPVFRMLSNVTVHAKHNPIHFPADVLKKSIPKLVGQTVNIDHESAVGNAIGVVKDAEWQEAYTTKDGIKVPAGINATLKIDGKSNPRIARGVMMDPPSIHANSVTVSFGWRKSHPEMADEEFIGRLATFDDKGNFIQRIVTEVQAYHETSLVGHGADPFAQKVNKKGEIVKPNYARETYPLSEQIVTTDGTELNVVYYDWKTFSAEGFDDGILKESTNNQNQSKMKETLKLLEVIFGLAEGTLTEENHEEKLKELNTELTSLKAKANEPPAPVKVLNLEGVEAIETEINTLRTFKAGVPENLAEVIAMGETGKTFLSELKEDTKRLYKLSIPEGKEDASILAVIDNSEAKTLKALHKQYDTITEGKFDFHCVDCGSTHVTRASANPNNEESAITNRSVADVIELNTSIGKVDTSFFEGKK